MTERPLVQDVWAMPARRSLPDMIGERIIEAIRTGDLRPGDRVVESQLAKRLGVSRGPLREAMRALQANHLLETRSGRGVVVADVGTHNLGNMVAMRAVLEGLAARQVAERRTPEMIQLLTSLHSELKRAASSGDTSTWRDLSWRFHETICVLSGNAFLLRAWQSISNLVRLFLHTHPDFERDIPSVLRNHDDELAALRYADPDKAEQIVRDIIMRSAAKHSRADSPLTRPLAVPGSDVKPKRANGTRARSRSEAKGKSHKA